MRRRHEQADDGPARFRIDPAENPRPFEPHVLLTRRDGAPPHWLVTLVGEHAGRPRAVAHQGTHAGPVLRAFALIELGPRESPVHAPAPTARTPGAEESDEVVPPLRREWSNVER